MEYTRIIVDIQDYELHTIISNEIKNYKNEKIKDIVITLNSEDVNNKRYKKLKKLYNPNIIIFVCRHKGKSNLITYLNIDYDIIKNIKNKIDENTFVLKYSKTMLNHSITFIEFRLFILFIVDNNIINLLYTILDSLTN